MKTIKVISELGIVDAEVKKVFEFENYKFAIVNFPYKYMNSKDISYIMKVVHYGSEATMPIFVKHKQTIKSFLELSINTIDSIFKRVGVDDFKKEMEKYEIINPI